MRIGTNYWNMSRNLSDKIIFESRWSLWHVRTRSLLNTIVRLPWRTNQSEYFNEICPFIAVAVLPKMLFPLTLSIALCFLFYENTHSVWIFALFVRLAQNSVRHNEIESDCSAHSLLKRLFFVGGWYTPWMRATRGGRDAQHSAFPRNPD